MLSKRIFIPLLCFLFFYAFIKGNYLQNRHQTNHQYNKIKNFLTPAYQVLDSTLAKKYFEIAEQYGQKATRAFYDSAIVYYAKANEIFVAQEDWENDVRCKNKMGEYSWKKGALKEALLYLNGAQARGRSKLGEQHLEVASTYYNKSIVYRRQGRYEEAISFNEKALSIRRTMLGEQHIELAKCYNNFGNIYAIKGDYDKALNFNKKTLSIVRKELGDQHVGVADSYSNIGNIYVIQGDFEQALSFHRKALSIRLNRFGDQHPMVAVSYANLGIAYRQLGSYDQALDYFKKSLEIWRAKFGENHRYVAHCYDNIGNVYSDKREYEEALVWDKKALAVRLANAKGEQHPDVAMSYHSIGVHYKNIGKLDEALHYYDKARTIRIAAFGTHHPLIASVYKNLGNVFVAKGQLDKALSFYQEAICANAPQFTSRDIYANPPLNNILSNLELLRSLSFKAKTLGKRYTDQSSDLRDLKAAMSTYELVVQLIDQMRMGFKAEESKFFLTENVTDRYENAIQLSLRFYHKTKSKKDKEVAFLFAEKSKSTVLQEALLETNAQRFAGIPDSLLEMEKSLKIDLAFYDTARQKEKQKKNAKQDSLKIRDFEDRYFDLNRQYQQLVEQFEKEYPRYYGLKYRTQTVTVKEIQEHLTEKDAVLEYFVGDSALNIFTISKDGFEVASVDIDSAFGHFVQQLPLNIKRLNRKAYLKNAYLLYAQLIEPVEAHLTGKEKLAIIPHGKLFYLPFEAILTEKAATENYSALPYFIKKYGISYHYSATLFVNSFKTTNSNAQGFFGIAPVVFRERTVPEKFLAMVREVFRDSTLQDLQASKTEVSTIAALFQNNQQPSDIYFYEQAKEDCLKSARIKDYRYLHIATHGLINEDKPKLSHLIFSQPPDPDVQDDGILYASEIFNLELNADLVVLSSCESGIGKLVKGEGMLAINRGFLYAGAENIVFSLWKVPDKHTSRLMIEFYKHILSQEGFPAGGSYAGSLRAAKLKLIANEETAHPSNWSGFVLLGK